MDLETDLFQIFGQPYWKYCQIIYFYLIDATLSCAKYVWKSFQGASYQIYDTIFA